MWKFWARRTPHKTSDFGDGLAYPIALFLAHGADLHRDIETYRQARALPGAASVGPDGFSDERAVGLWFYGAADHAYGILWEHAPKHLQRRVREFQNKLLGWRLPIGVALKPTLADAEWALEEARNLLLEIDRAHGVPAVKATNE